MNPGLDQLQQYPFERLNALKAGLTPPPVSPIVMAIGEPKHEAPDFVLETLKKSLGGLSIYPLTAGTPELREAIAGWLSRRFQLAEKIQACHVLPVNGTREALFAVAQCFAPGPKHKGQAAAPPPPVLMPNPFYQIYEGAALLCGARPYYIDIDSESGLPRYEDVPESVWQDCTLLYVCTPGNPTGAVMPLELLGELVKKALKYNFVIASDECYSELYFDEGAPPAGILQAALKVGNDGLENCLAFHSLSKRSSLPGMRSGFVAGNANLIETFRLYRTYQGGAMPPPIQTASIAAWNDEAHVQANRALYRRKFQETAPVLAEVLPVTIPAGGFYYWLKTPGDDKEFARELYRHTNVTVLPGSYLARGSLSDETYSPGRGYVRMALVATAEECLEAARRTRDFVKEFYGARLAEA